MTIGKMMDLLDITSARPLLRYQQSRCPHCGSKRIDLHATRTTLLGGGGDVNPNHVWSEGRCQSCGRTLYRESKTGNAWFTDERGHVIAGMPSCFEGYTYPCAVCGGKVTRSYTALDGVSRVGGLCGDHSNYRTFYRCELCGHGGETTPVDYYQPAGGR